MIRLPIVALFTRAWIEITTQLITKNLATVALFTRAWIEISISTIVFGGEESRPLHEGVD